MTLEQIYGYVAIGIWVIVALFVLMGALKGRSRGIGRQSVRTVTIVGSLFLSIFLTKLLYKALTTWLDSTTTAEIVAKIEGLGMSLSSDEFDLFVNYFDTKTLNYVLAIPLATVLLPVIFVLIFGIIRLLSLIVHVIFSGIFGFSKRRNNWVTRLLGALLGAVQGAAIAIICFVPCVGLLTTASDTMKMLQTEAPDTEVTEALTLTYDEYLKPLAECQPVSLMSKCGGKLLYNNLSTVELYGNKHQMSTELTTAAIKFYATGIRLSDMDWQNLTDENKKDINEILSALNESKYISISISRVLDAAAVAYSEGAYEFTAEGEANSLLGDTVGIFRGMNEKELIPTLNVVRDVYYILSDEGVITELSGSSTAALSDIFTVKDEHGETVINRITHTLETNPRTAPLVGTITKISVTVMADKFGGVEIDEETYQEISTGVKDVIKIDKNNYSTKEEYVSAISDSLSATFTENEINLDKEIVDGMAEYVADNYSDHEHKDITDAELNDIILSYYDAYVQANGEINPDDLPDNIPEDLIPKG